MVILQIRETVATQAIEAHFKKAEDSIRYKRILNAREGPYWRGPLA